MHYDVIVIGAGSMGMAAGYQLAKASKHVLVIDRYNPPHDQASHHGETRIIRYAYGEGENYVPLLLRARELWAELEKEVHKELLVQVGTINVSREESTFMQNVIKSAEQYALPLEILTADQTMKRFPGMYMPEDFISCFEPTAGFLRVEDCVQAYRDRAVHYGATVLVNTPVVRIVPQEQHIEVHTKSSVHTANQIIITTGAWAKEVLQEVDVDLPVTPTRKTFAWYEADDALYGNTHYPTFGYELDDAFYYGFPSDNGAGLKVSRHDGGDALDPNGVREEFNDADAADLTRFLDHYMPEHGPLKFGKTCMYAMTPDEDFIIDQHPDDARIHIAAGFSGHGFKFASVVGEILKDFVVNGKSDLNLTDFSLQRFK